jgi:hypothetical protein
VSTGAWVFGLLLASPQAAAKPLKIEFAWLALVLPVAGFALSSVVRAFTAEDRVRRDCHDQVVEVRDSTVSAEIRPTLGTIIVKIQPYMHWPDPSSYLPGEPGDPQLDAARILGYRQASFSDAFGALEDHYVKIHSANAVHGLRVGHARRSGGAMFIFLVAWIYLSLWLTLPDVYFPNVTSVAAVAVLAVSGGWAASEWWSSNRENNVLSVLAREASQLSGGRTR